MTFDDPEVNTFLDNLRNMGAEYATIYMAGVAALGDGAGPAEWERLFVRAREIIRSEVERWMKDETDPYAPHAAELMVQTMEESFFSALGAMSLAVQPAEGTA